MRRRLTLLALSLSLAIEFAIFDSIAAHAANIQRVVRLAVVSPGSPSTDPPDSRAFWERLRELGYVEGQNLLIEWRWAQSRLDRLPALMADVVALKVDVLVTWTTAGAVAAKGATRTIPIVAAPMADPVQSGLVDSLAHPGGNLTGLSVAWTQGFAGKWIELLKETVPRLSTVAVTANPDLPVQLDIVKELEAIASTRGIKLRVFEVRNAQALDRAFELAGQTVQAVVVMADPITVNERARVTMLAAKHRLPAVYGLRDFVEAGGLMAYGFDQVVIYRRAADYVDRIIRGANPAELPIEQPTRYLLVVNLKAARALGLKIPESILLRADEVIR